MGSADPSPGRGTRSRTRALFVQPAIAGIYVQPMLSYACGHCGHLVFFENTRCLNCDTPQGFVPARLELVALEGEWADLHRCANQTLAACNWMVDAVDTLCRSCELTRTR